MKRHYFSPRLKPFLVASLAVVAVLSGCAKQDPRDAITAAALQQDRVPPETPLPTFTDREDSATNTEKIEMQREVLARQERELERLRRERAEIERQRRLDADLSRFGSTP